MEFQAVENEQKVKDWTKGNDAEWKNPPALH